MQPRPRADTSRLLFPNLRFCIDFSCDSLELLRNAPPRREARGGIVQRLLGLERSHIDREAILHVGLEQTLVGFIDLLDGDDFDVRDDVVLPAEVEHLLSLGDAPNWRT